MRKPAAYLFAILIGAIVWFFFQHFRVEGTNLIRVVPKTEEELNRTGDAEGNIVKTDTDTNTEADAKGSRLPGFSFLSGITGGKQEDTAKSPTAAPVGKQVSVQAPKVERQHSSDAIRVASFHLHHFGARTADAESVNMIAQVVRLFDIVALQGISPGGSAAVVALAQRAGPNFEVIQGDPASIQQIDERFAYIINKNTIVADRGDGLYTLGDPDGLLRRDPLVGWFRAKAAPPEDAFTFTLVSVNTEQGRRQQELSVLDNAVHEIRNDGREEDDVIIMGSFQANENQLGELGRLSGLVAAVRGIPTDLLGQTQTENILFQNPATDEFTGAAGVFHFLRAFNLTTDDARLVSDHLPVWAEFSIYEGGQQGRVARRAGR